jgi:hypothetical protein
MHCAKVFTLLFVLALLGLTFPTPGLSCDFGYNSIPKLFRTADAVFIGKVIESPWKRTADGATATTGAKPPVRFLVERRLKATNGASLTEGAEVKLASDLRSCVFAFLEGETYLIHAFRSGDQLDSGQPERPLLLSDATEALKYIEGSLNKRPLGVVQGRWFYIRDRNGETSAIPSTRKLTVHLQGATEHLQATIRPEPYSEVAAPPGVYEVWLELDEKVVSAKKSIRIIADEAVFADIEAILDR